MPYALLPVRFVAVLDVGPGLGSTIAGMVVAASASGNRCAGVFGSASISLALGSPAPAGSAHRR